MALAEDQAVAIRVGRRAGIDLQHGEEQGRQRIRRRQIPADVTETRPTDHFHDAPADLGGDFPQSIPALGGVDGRRQRVEDRSAAGGC